MMWRERRVALALGVVFLLWLRRSTFPARLELVLGSLRHILKVFLKFHIIVPTSEKNVSKTICFEGEIGRIVLIYYVLCLRTRDSYVVSSVPSFYASLP